MDSCPVPSKVIYTLSEEWKGEENGSGACEETTRLDACIKKTQALNKMSDIHNPRVFQNFELTQC